VAISYRLGMGLISISLFRPDAKIDQRAIAE
jgi:hypothetical protein